MRSFLPVLLATLAFIGTCPLLLSAQGILVVDDPHVRARLPRPIIHPEPRPTPVPQMSYKIGEIAVNARLQEQVAQVQVSQTFVNTGSRQMEVSFLFPLPYDGAIDSLTLLVDGKEYPAKLLPAKEARSIYEGIVRRNQDPALLEWMGSGMFKTSVFPVPAGAERKVTLRYSQLCRKDHGLTDFLFPLSTAKYTSKPVEKIEFRITVESKQEIKNVYSPTHAVGIKRPDNHHATVTFQATNQVPAGDFRLFYDVGTGELGASVLSYRPESSEEGYFLMLASPQIQSSQRQRPKKTVIFVLDRSGSMSGEKIKQAREALKFVLNNLREGDLFNIVAYDTSVESFRPELEKYNNETRQQALGFVEGIYAGGGTNIDGALTSALSQLKDEKRPSYVLFLTDGLPTIGEQNEAKIVEHAKQNNQVRARLINLGVGYDVNSRLLDRLSRANHGQSEYVRPGEDLEEHVSRLYSRISSPILTDVAIQFEYDEAIRPEQGNPINRVYPQEVMDLFEGEQLVLVGRYRKAGPIKVTIAGNVDGQTQQFDFPAQLTERSGDESHAFVEKLWAMRRIGEIIDELDLHGQNEELVKELVALSTKHGILTPYTSFLADDQVNVREVARNADRARGNIGQLDEAAGKAGFVQRAEKQRLKAAQQAPAAAPLGGEGKGGGNVVRDLKSDKDVVVHGLRNVGNKAFYRRQADQRWVDSTVTDELEKNAKRVEQFSDEYFKLARKHARTLSKYLVFDDPVLVNLDGQAYFIDPPAN